jgi:hypothetical protein
MTDLINITHNRRHRWAFFAATILAALAIVLITASVAMANHTTVTGTWKCSEAEVATITWTVHSDETEQAVVLSSSRGLFDGLPVGTQTRSENAVTGGSVEMVVNVRFFPPGTSPGVSEGAYWDAVKAYQETHPKWVPQRRNVGTVTIPPDACQPTTTTTTTTTTTNPTTTTTTTTTTVPVTTTTTPVTTTTVPVVTTTVPTTPTITQPIPRDSLGAVPGDKCPKAKGVQTERPCQKLGPPLVDRPDQPTPPAATPALPDTGAGDNRPAAWFGVGAIVVGALMLAAGLLRKRGA